MNTDIITSDNVFALFDEQFTINELRNSIINDRNEANTVIFKIREAIYNAAINNTEEKETRFVVDLDDELKNAIHEGRVKLVTNSQGQSFAQLVDEKGRFGPKLPIKEELEEQGLSIEKAEFALQMNAIGEKLEEIISAINKLENRISDVLEGQHNDRLGLFYSGTSLFIEAQTINDEILKKQITAQALKSLSDANAQLIQELRASVRYLVTEKYLKSKNKKADIDEHLEIINQCYYIIYRASFLKVTIYLEEGEIQAMLAAMNEYRRFVENLIVPYAGKLSELDAKNPFIEKGTWATICNTLKGCNDLKTRITQNHTYYLIGEVSNNGKR